MNMQIEEKHFKEYLMKHLRHNYEHNGKEEAESRRKGRRDRAGREVSG